MAEDVRESAEDLGVRIRGLERELRRQRLQLDTVVEVVRQVNARGLDLEVVENFTLNVVMGQFAVPRSVIFRKLSPFADLIVCSRGKNMNLPKASFSRTGDLGRFLMEPEHRGVVALTGTVLNFPEAEVLRQAGLRWLVPLVRRADDQEELMGVVGLGARAGGGDFERADRELLGLIADVVAISLHNATLYHRSIFDDLTQVYSRGYFDLHLAQEVERIRRYGQVEGRCLTLAMLDVDHFKRFNDTHGHQAGDRVLRAVAESLRESLRATDVVSRYGGEEFAIILPETPKSRCAAVGDRLRTRIEALVVQGEGGRSLSVSASLGLATYPDDAAEPVTLIRAADKALYRAKETGRNRVELA